MAPWSSGYATTTSRCGGAPQMTSPLQRPARVSALERLLAFGLEQFDARTPVLERFALPHGIER